MGPSPDNPFRAARLREGVRELHVGIHTAGLSDAPTAEQVVVRQELTTARPRVSELIRSAGPERTGVQPDVPVVSLQGKNPGSTTAVMVTSDQETHSAVTGHDLWRFIVDEELRDPTRMQTLLELEGLVAMGADFVVTEDRTMLELRDHNLLGRLRLVTPDEALVLVGVWSRTVHRAFVRGPIGVNNGLYYWALARALTPAGWPAFCAWVKGEQVLPAGPVLFELAQSILGRLVTIGRALDILVATWICPTDNDTDDEIIDEFDRVVINAWAIYDNIALLVGRYLGIDLPSDQPAGWGLLQRDWRRSMARVQDKRAAALVDLVRAEEPRLAMVHELRGRALHQARPRLIRVASGRSEEARLWIEGDHWQRLLAAIQRDGSEPSEWGVDRVFEPRRESVSVVGSVDGTSDVVEEYDIDLGASAWLDPVAIAPKLAAHAAWMADRAFGMLDPVSDPRIPGKETCGRVPSDFYFSEPGATAAVLESPLSGLVHWREALAPDAPFQPMRLR